MKRITALTPRGVLLAGALVIALGLAVPAFAAREAASEAGRWVGFAAQTSRPPNPCVLDIMSTGPLGSSALAGTLSGLPAVQDASGAPVMLSFTGSVTLFGRLSGSLQGGGVVGFCDGSVRQLLNFGQRGGQDDIGELNYRLTDASGMSFSGHINMIHLYGGMGWAQMVVPSLGSGGVGSCLPAVQDELSPASLVVYPPDPGVAGVPSGSQFAGMLAKGVPGGGDLQSFQLVGTINERGSLVMLGVGVKPPSPNMPALIGLLFTGALGAVNPGPPTILGHYGTAGFGVLLPAIQLPAIQHAAVLTIPVAAPAP